MAFSQAASASLRAAYVTDAPLFVKRLAKYMVLQFFRPIVEGKRLIS
jgi:hypothetical protein